MASPFHTRPFRLSPALVLPSGDLLQSLYFPTRLVGAHAALAVAQHRWSARTRLLPQDTHGRWGRVVHYHRLRGALGAMGAGGRSPQPVHALSPELLLILLTQVQWSAHRAQHGPPPTEGQDEQSAAARPPDERPDSPGPVGADDVDSPESDAATPESGPGDGYAPRRRRRRRRRPINRSSDSSPLC